MRGGPDEQGFADRGAAILLDYLAHCRSKVQHTIVGRAAGTRRGRFARGADPARDGCGGSALANPDEEWRCKGGTLSDKTARKEYGLTQDEILAAIDAGQLQYRVGSVHGNPWLRLVRREVEDLMSNVYNDRQHKQRRAKAQLAAANKELKQLHTQVAALEERRAELLAVLGE